MRTIILCILLISFNLKASSQVLTSEEQELYRILMNYRSQLGLPSIPFSKSLTIVAQTHVRDLNDNKPDKGRCNMHSWSSNGPWTGCCYTPDHAQANCMWSKPRELTNYKGSGYEIACGSWSSGDSDYNITANEALESWKGSQGHNQVIINAGIWNDKWNAIGIGMYKGYAVVWFGKELDNEK